MIFLRAFLVLVAVFLATCARSQTDAAPFIVVDQFGYLPDLQKRAIIRNPIRGFDSDLSFRPGSRYALVNVSTGEVVHEDRPVAWKGGQIDEPSGDRVWWYDFTSVSTPGTYVVRDVDREIDSDPFEISDAVYRGVLQAAFKSIYYQRAGFEKRAPYAAEGYRDAASHIGRGQDTEARRWNGEGPVRDLRGGWYDAGDYNQYTSWTANYVSSLLASYVENPRAWTDDMGIPESGNGIPDILDEVIWGLAWLERMQNEDGSMLFVLGRGEGSPPSTATDPSRYGDANTSATVTAAGAFAMAADVMSDGPEAQKYRSQALRAWAWALDNPDRQFWNNSEEHGTQGLAAGQQEVEGDRLRKKFLIAATQIYGLTRERDLIAKIEALYKQIGGIKPDSASGFEGDMPFTLLNFANMPSVPDSLSRKIRSDYQTAMEGWNGWPAIDEQEDAYGSFVEGYWWGSNGTKSRRGSVYTQSVLADAHGRTRVDPLNAGSHYLHYLHGVNPMGLVYLTNMTDYGAERSVDTLYHAWFKDGSELFDDVRTSTYGPVPGFLVGGPNDGYSRDDCCPKSCGGYGRALCRLPKARPPHDQPPAKSYAQFNEGWPLNSWEVTENSLGYQTDYIRLLSKYVR